MPTLAERQAAERERREEQLQKQTADAIARGKEHADRITALENMLFGENSKKDTENPVDKTPKGKDDKTDQKIDKEEGEIPAVGNEDLTGRPQFQGRNNRFTAQQRSEQLRDWLLKNSGIGKSLSPEMQRSEHFTRLADRLNNRTYFDPGAGTWTRHGPVGMQEAKSYRMPKMETEDQRAQEMNRELQANIAQGIQQNVMGEQQNQNTYESIRRLNDEAINQMLRSDEAQLFAELRRIDLGVMYKSAIQAAAAENYISEQRVKELVRLLQKKSWFAAATLGVARGMAVPDLMKTLIGEGAAFLNKMNINEAMGALENAFVDPETGNIKDDYKIKPRIRWGS